MSAYNYVCQSMTEHVKSLPSKQQDIEQNTVYYMLLVQMLKKASREERDQYKEYVDTITELMKANRERAA